MFGHKRASSWGLVIVLAAAGGACLAERGAAAERNGHRARPTTSRAKPERHVAPPPRLSSADQACLIRFIRGTIDAVVAGRTPDRLTDVPAGLAALRCPVFVTLRRGGYVVGLGQSSGQDNVADACRAAAVSALKSGGHEAGLTAPMLKRLAVEVELLGPVTPVPRGLVNPERLAWECAPGMDGLAIRLDDREAVMLPSQIVATGGAATKALETLQRRLGTSKAELQRRAGRAVCLRFRTLHFWQAEPGQPVVELHRGCAPVRPEAVTAKHLDQAAGQIARYLQARQGPDGSFRDAYLPWADQQPSDISPPMIQAGAAWALAVCGESSRDAAAMAAAARTVRELSSRLVPLDATAYGPAYVRSPRQADRLGATAMLLLAAAELRPVETCRPLRRRLAGAILTRQRPTGMMQTNFAATQTAAPQDVDAGQAMLALTRCVLLDRDEPARSALGSAFDHYQKVFEIKPTLVMMPWLAGAYAQLAAAGGHRRFADEVFRMIDWLEPCQLSAADCPWPVMHGGVEVDGNGLPDITTALHMSAVADALVLARRLGDKDRVSRYERMLRSGMRFVLQLQFRPEECYYVRSRFETVGGVRTAPWDHTLTVENAQLALLSLVKARRALFP